MVERSVVTREVVGSSPAGRAVIVADLVMRQIVNLIYVSSKLINHTKLNMKLSQVQSDVLAGEEQ